MLDILLMTNHSVTSIDENFLRKTLSAVPSFILSLFFISSLFKLYVNLIKDDFSMLFSQESLCLQCFYSLRWILPKLANSEKRIELENLLLLFCSHRYPETEVHSKNSFWGYQLYWFYFELNFIFFTEKKLPKLWHLDSA